ncbi:hypothetical protein GTO27_10635, partial [Candidatus Bathyarchaeota archaeon]|nr:hypothetical protein [Candidatus Bathyarchaeota archaeon]
MDPISNIEQLRELAWAFRASRVLQVASKLEIFTLLSQGTFTASEVAEHCKSDPEMTEKLLIACTALGLTRLEKGRYRNSDLAERYLVKDKRSYQGNWIDHSSDLWEEWSNLEKWIGGKKLSGKRKNGHRRFIMAMH